MSREFTKFVVNGSYAITTWVLNSQDLLVTTHTPKTWAIDFTELGLTY